MFKYIQRNLYRINKLGIQYREPEIHPLLSTGIIVKQTGLREGDRRVNALDDDHYLRGRVGGHLHRGDIEQ